MRFNCHPRANLFRYFVCVILVFGEASCLGQVEAYFPDKVFWEWKDATLGQEYSKSLRSLQEPSLWQVSKTQETPTYRFLLMPEAREIHGAPRSVRLDIQADGTSIITTREGGHKSKVRTLTFEQTRAFLDLVEKGGFWNLPSAESDPGPDGRMWVIEGVRNKQYHVVERWSPRGDIHQLGAMLMRNLAGMKVSRHEL